MRTEFVTRERLWYAVLLFLSVIGAAVLLPLPDLYRAALILAIPAVVVGIIILKNPFVGIYLYYLYDFLRPYDFITALRPLKLSLPIEALTLLSLALMLIRTRRAVKWDLLNWIYLFFMADLAVGTYLASNNYFAFKVFRLMLINFIMYIAATNIINRVRRFTRIWWLLILIHVFNAGKGIFDYVFHPGAAASGAATVGAVGGSYLADENDFALAMNVLIPFVFFTMIYSKKMLTKLLCSGMLVVLVTAVVMSFSRGGWVGIVAAAVFCVWYSGRRLNGFIGLAFAGILFVTLAPSEYMSEIETISDTREATAESRLHYWRAAVKMLISYPLVGVGPGNGGVHMPEFIEGIADPETQWGRAFHGLFPQVMAETGGIGLLLYLLLIFYVLTFLNKIRKRKIDSGDQRLIHFWALGLMGSIVTYLITATFLSTAYYPQLWTLYTLSISLLWIQRSIDRRRESETAPNNSPSEQQPFRPTAQCEKDYPHD